MTGPAKIPGNADPIPIEKRWITDEKDIWNVTKEPTRARDISRKAQ